MKVAVVMGGYSSEREISLCTGEGVLRALSRLGHEAVCVDFDADFVKNVRTLRPNVVFNALHGTGGEDGTIQGVLEWMRLPYTGSDVLASAISMDKHLTKKLLLGEGLPTAPWDIVRCANGAMPPVPAQLRFPLVIKPRAQGSSQGVCFVHTQEEWERTLAENSACEGDLLVEEFVKGAEFSCGVLFDRALPVIEIVPQDAFYSFDAKYSQGGSTHFVPARIEEELAKRLQTLALSVHCLIGLRDYSRTDIIVTEEGRPCILEINALPGLTPTSLLPEECAVVGISYDMLIERLITAAAQRGNRLCA